MVEWNRLLNQTVIGEAATRAESGDLLPNFCRGELVLRVVVVAELLALVVSVLVEGRYSESPLVTLVMVSLFVQWIALTSVVLLCVLRRWLNTLPSERAFIMAYLLLLCVTIAITELSFWVMCWIGSLESPRPQWYARFHIQNLVISIVVNALLLRYLLGRDELRRVTQSKEQARSEIMKYRIRPHFLFNTMNVTAGLLRQSPARAEAAIEDLADLFRLMLDENKTLVPLKKEVELAEKYLSLEKLRLDDRLVVDWDSGEIPRMVRTPVQILQLMLEHAIHVGIEPLADGGQIGITIRADEDQVRIRIECPESPVVAGILKSEQMQDAGGLTAGGGKRQSDGPTARDSSMSSDAARRGGASAMRSGTVVDTTALDNLRLRLQDLYHGSGVLETHVQNERYIITVRHAASGGVE